MEYFRTWGIDRLVLEHAVPADYRPDVAFTETLAGAELGRLRFPTIREMIDRTPETLRTYPQLSWSRFGKVVIGQSHLEPVLFDASEQFACVRNLKGVRVVAFEEASGEVSVVAEEKSGKRLVITAQYVVGCDGGRSAIRERLGASLEGIGEVGRSVNTYFDCPGLLQAIGKEPAAIYWSLRPDATGAILAVDGHRKWVFSRHLLPDETFSEDQHPSTNILAALGVNVPLTVLSSWFWIPRQLVSTSYGSGRIYLAGDSAHLMSPTGGYGLNTGLGDAVNLGWKLAAVLKGWGHPALLSTYEQERRPMAVRASKEATDNRAFTREILKTGALLLDESTRGPALAFIERTMHRHGKHFDGNGIYLGDRYDHSPVIVDDDSPQIPWDAEVYLPISKPGNRLPAQWIGPSATTHDACGRDFTLITQNPAATQPLQQAFAQRGIPLKVTPLEGNAHWMGPAHLLVRPDGIVAWKGRSFQDPAGVAMRVSGFQLSVQATARQDSPSPKTKALS